MLILDNMLKTKENQNKQNNKNKHIKLNKTKPINHFLFQKEKVIKKITTLGTKILKKKKKVSNEYRSGQSIMLMLRAGNPRGRKQGREECPHTGNAEERRHF